MMTRSRNVWLRTRTVLIDGDTNTIRVILAVASLFFAVILVWPGNNAFQRFPIWSVMRATFSAPVWAAIFMVHFAGVLWRQFDDKPRPYAAFAINAYGLLIWFIMTGMNAQALGEIGPSSAMELTILCAAAVALVRTGLNDEKISP